MFTCARIPNCVAVHTGAMSRPTSGSFGLPAKHVSAHGVVRAQDASMARSGGPIDSQPTPHAWPHTGLSPTKPSRRRRAPLRPHGRRPQRGASTMSRGMIGVHASVASTPDCSSPRACAADSGTRRSVPATRGLKRNRPPPLQHPQGTTAHKSTVSGHYNHGGNVVLPVEVGGQDMCAAPRQPPQKRSRGSPTSREIELREQVRVRGIPTRGLRLFVCGRAGRACSPYYCGRPT